MGLALISLALLTGGAAADDSSFPAFRGPVPSTFDHSGLDLEIGTTTGYTYYYIAFEYTDSLLRPFTTLALSLGSPASTFLYTRTESARSGFIRLAAIDVFSPRDTDHDCMDDYWELTHELNPMDPSDALHVSPLDPSKTNLQYYLDRFGASKVTTLVSPEVSLRNHPFAISPEVSVFTGGRLEAISPEMSVLVVPFIQTVSPEVSVLVVPFN